MEELIKFSFVTCPNCNRIITVSKSVTEAVCQCGKAIFVVHSPAVEQVVPIGGGAVLVLNIN